MPGGSPEAYKYIEDIVSKVAAQVRRLERPVPGLARPSRGHGQAAGATRGRALWVSPPPANASQRALTAPAPPRRREPSKQVDDGPCVMYVGDGGAGNYVKMVHNGIEYGDMQLISGVALGERAGRGASGRGTTAATPWPVLPAAARRAFRPVPDPAARPSSRSAPAEAYDVLRVLGGLSNEEMAATFK
jgi:hypothetical protein